jgi:hypothetical protein
MAAFKAVLQAGQVVDQTQGKLGIACMAMLWLAMLQSRQV